MEVGSIESAAPTDHDPDTSSLPPPIDPVPPNTDHGGSPRATAPPKLSAAGITSWAKNLKIPISVNPQDDAHSESSSKSTFSRFTSGLGIRLSPKSPSSPTNNVTAEGSTLQPGGFIGTITKGLVDTSKNAVKAVQVKARHAVSQNKRRYQEGGFDLDMTYITENIIAMGFPAGDMSSGFFGFVEGFYRNHMEEVIKFFETHHKDKYKVYNLCSERLYDASLFEGKVACFPFDDHNCPPIQLIISFCQSAYSWLREDIENVVVVHCKAGMARTGLMISSLLLYLKFFPTAEESIDYYNQKRCVDGKGLVLPSQIRYVKYFERTLTYFNGENQPGRRCMLRGFRLHRCPYWIRPSITVSDHNGILFTTKKHPRTKDLSSEDFWFGAPKKGVMVFTLPGERGLTEVCGDFKVHFHDRQGDFYFWLNTTMMENRKMMNTSDIDGFDKRKLPSPGFFVEVVLLDHSTVVSSAPSAAVPVASPPAAAVAAAPAASASEGAGKEDVFSDSEGEESSGGRPKSTQTGSGESDKVKSVTNEVEKMSLGNVEPQTDKMSLGNVEPQTDKMKSGPESEFKAMAADASVFSFGDDEDYESE